MRRLVAQEVGGGGGTFATNHNVARNRGRGDAVTVIH